jgi:hypothetical protein
MKKLLLSAIVASAATVGVYAQGTINVDNSNNGNTSPSAASGGLVFLQTGNAAPVLYGQNFSVEVFGGASAGSLSPIVTLTGANQVDNFGGGVFVDPNGGTYAVPGVALSGTATLEVEAWTGNFTSYAAASAQGSGAAFGEVIFQNATGGGGTPPGTPVDLVGMPALVLTTPEPSTIALGGLGAAALMLFRRRK